MARYDFKLPDIGEGIAEAEIVAWHVKVGDTVEEDQQLADMMTDKATVEMESPGRRQGGRAGGRGRRHDRDRLGAGGDRDRGRGRGGSTARRRRPSRRSRSRTDDGRSAERAMTRPCRRAAVEAAAPPARQRRASAQRHRRRSPRTERTRRSSPPPPSAPRAKRPRHRPRRGEAAPATASATPTSTPICSTRRRRLRAGAGRARQDETDQGRRPAPPDRREHGGGEAPHPAFHLCRGIRRHRARGDARDAERRPRRPAQADPAAVPDRRDLPDAARFPMLNARYDDEAGVVTRHGAVHLGMATQTEAA